MNRTITPNELRKLLAQSEIPVIFDVRRKADYEADSRKISGAMWLDPDKVAQWSTALPHNKEIVIYCVRGGSVSNAVLDVLQGKGFKARFIEGGIEAWKVAGGPTVAK